jgi:hypothetical protein
MPDFSITSTDLIDYTLALQKLNDVALPFAVQETLNEVAKDVKKRTLIQSVNEEFEVDRKSFFTANSGYKPYKAKQAGYDINKMKAEVGMIKGTNPNEKATEQIGHQETRQPIKRGINPLGNKPQTKNVIDILSKKPEFVTYDKNDDRSPFNYIKGAARAKKRNASLVITNPKGTGQVFQVKKFDTRKPTKKNPNKLKIKLKNIASYHKGGDVKLRRKAPFLSNATEKSATETMENAFIKAAEKQISRIWKK